MPSSKPIQASWQTLAEGRKDASTQAMHAFARAQGLDLYALHDRLASNPGRNVTHLSLEGILSNKDLQITETVNLDELLRKLREGEWSSEEVTAAFCRRAVVAHELTNCLTETFFDRALARARELDQILKKTGKPVGPLHGLCISLKDQIDVEGVELNMGYVGAIGNISKQNAVLVDILLKAGAVLYCKTNIPQTLMAGETVNNVYGRTVNPHNGDLTCGGSSGGEGECDEPLYPWFGQHSHHVQKISGALIAMRGSPLGVGTDIGGSIRIPAGFNGIYGFKPSYNRIPYQGATNSMVGFEAIPSVAGPMSSSIAGLKLFVKAVVEAEPWRVDPYVTYRPWQDELYQLKDYAGGNKLCFGLWRDDGHCRPAAPYARALDKTKKALEAGGHTVIDWSFDDALEGLKILVDLYAADGEKGFDIACAESGEPRIFGRMNRGDGKELTASQYWELCARRKVYVKSQLDAWEATSSITGTGRPLDAIIGPVSCHAPEVHGVAAWGWYTGLANLHDYPVGLFPVIQVDPKLDPSAPAPASYRSATEKRIQETYDPVLYEDAPIGLQCMGRKGQDEAILRMTEIIDAALRKAGKANL
ncbi:BZ3500_MvSof-1268-A1-R1_Chr8-2g10097 [Microbotryum saponariae]|uniref:BZ3500_MvSof-1268-A1-R1_Chr8-2g10097 protein n=1 Tax=Microbotryum saponariae TaxID=289078 RepID=A0A2X0L7X3_9BASI|nr:BZ3500_MvSof-1268-A1-R1_Chr8-2g10097 [Microbotryum saponariae]SDA01779.1 BZ3501_MvSof-1269-A2-R1_Chr8-2g09848 [Microbotryum saponariae]